MFTLFNKRTKSEGETNHCAVKSWEWDRIFSHRVFIRWPPFLFIHFGGIFNQDWEVITYLLHSQTHIAIMLCEPRNKTKTEKRVSNPISIAFSTIGLNASPFILLQNGRFHINNNTFKLYWLPENLNGSLSDGSAGKIFLALWRHKNAFSREGTRRSATLG